MSTKSKGKSGGKAKGKGRTSGPGFREVSPATPRNRRLPEMEDEKIDAIEDAANEYADVRDRRMLLTPKEVAAKKRILDAMHASGKTKYRRGALFVQITTEKEKVTVKVKPAGKGEDE